MDWTTIDSVGHYQPIRITFERVDAGRPAKTVSSILEHPQLLLIGRPSGLAFVLAVVVSGATYADMS